MNKKIAGSFSLIFATIIWGSTFVAQSVGMDYVGPFTFQAVRCMLAVLVLLPVIALYDRKGKRGFWKKWLDKRLWLGGIACGIALFSAANLQQVGMVSTTAGKAGFLTAMYIVLVPFVGLFLKRRPGIMAIVSVPIAVVGLYLLSCANVSQINTGDILLFGSAFAFAIQITLVDSFAKQVDNLRLSCIQSLICALLTGIVMILYETPNVESILRCWLPICYAGILSMGVAYSLQIVGQRYIEPTAASLIMSLESVFAAISGWLILHERMSLQETVGCILVLSAVFLSQIPFKRIMSKPLT